MCDRRGCTTSSFTDLALSGDEVDHGVPCLQADEKTFHAKTVRAETRVAAVGYRCDDDAAYADARSLRVMGGTNRLSSARRRDGHPPRSMARSWEMRTPCPQGRQREAPQCNPCCRSQPVAFRQTQRPFRRVQHQNIGSVSRSRAVMRLCIPRGDRCTVGIMRALLTIAGLSTSMLTKFKPREPRSQGSKRPMSFPAQTICQRRSVGRRLSPDDPCTSASLSDSQTNPRYRLRKVYRQVPYRHRLG